jgi:hypothetical protein
MIRSSHGKVALFDAMKSRLVREVFTFEIRWAGLAPDDRVGVAATSNGSYGDTRFIRIETATC